VRGIPQTGVDFLGAGGFFELHHDVRHRAIRNRYPNGHPIHLSRSQKYWDRAPACHAHAHTRPSVFFLKVADFRESRCDNGNKFGAFLGALRHRMEDRCRGDGDAGDVNLIFDVQNRGVHPSAKHLTTPRVNRVDRARIAARKDVFHQAIADFLSIRRGADHGDTAGLK
jgi:hypothetical protein